MRTGEHVFLYGQYLGIIWLDPHFCPLCNTFINKLKIKLRIGVDGIYLCFKKLFPNAVYLFYNSMLFEFNISPSTFQFFIFTMHKNSL